jgi:hypothetical protein
MSVPNAKKHLDEDIILIVIAFESIDGMAIIFNIETNEISNKRKKILYIPYTEESSKNYKNKLLILILITFLYGSLCYSLNYYLLY